MRGRTGNTLPIRGTSHRAFDIVAAAAAVVLTSPAWVVIAVAIELDSGGPVFHRATRTGRYGQPFQLYKFRSMAVNADGPGVTAATDRRITRVGRVLRKSKLDELPQLLNVIRGDMALVGPRPEDPRYVALYTPEERRVLDVRPGLVSSAVIAYRHEEALLASASDVEETYTNKVMREKLAMDIRYLERASFRSDLGVLLGAIASIPRRRPPVAPL